MAKAGEMFSAQSRRVIIRLVLEYRLIPTSICHACCSGADHVPQANRLTVLVIEPRRLAQSHSRNRERCSLEIRVLGAQN